MQPSRTMIVRAKTACDAATDGGTNIACKTFVGYPLLFDTASVGATGAATANQTAGELLVINQTTLAIEAGDVVQVMQDISGYWYVVEGSGGGNISIRFTIETPYGEEEAHENCADQVATEATTWMAKVIAAPCGVTSIPDMDAENLIELTDPLGWLAEREDADVYGRSGTASYRYILDDEGYEVCRWEIDMINLFRAVINVTDVIDTGTNIDIYSENQSVWNNCKLPVEHIYTSDCEDDEYTY